VPTRSEQPTRQEDDRGNLWKCAHTQKWLRTNRHPDAYRCAFLSGHPRERSDAGLTRRSFLASRLAHGLRCTRTTN